MPPDPPRKLAPSALKKQAATHFPSGDVYFKTYWQPWAYFDNPVSTPWLTVNYKPNINQL